MRKYFGSKPFKREYIPADIINPDSISILRLSEMRNFDAFKEDENFLSILKACLAEGESYLISHQYSLRDIKNLIEKLDAALN